MGPVFVTYKAESAIDSLVGQVTAGEPEYEFDAEDGTRHTFWVISDSDLIGELEGKVNSLDCLYVADGHHRIAATTSYCTRLFTTQNKSVEELLFMAYVIPQSNLQIKSFHRLVKGINENHILSIIENPKDYSITKVASAFRPTKKGELGMYYKHSWYQIEINQYSDAPLDVKFLDSDIFRRKLGIEDTHMRQLHALARGYRHAAS